MKIPGLDITNADMVEPEEEPSQIQEFFAGSTVFLTGATGFVGKLMLEKLLRTCFEVKTVYVLIRPKKGKDVHQRFEELTQTVVFERLKREQPDALGKIRLVEGDCLFSNLGLQQNDAEKIKKEVNCVFHCAATVRFDVKIRTAAYINVRATMDLLTMAKTMPQLKSFIYVSTAFSHCVRDDIGEIFYEPPITAEDLLNLVDAMNDEKLTGLTLPLIDTWPNTYVFTKAIAEDVVKKHGKHLPVAVVRPTILIGTVNEPVAGFIDNVYGATGIFLGAALGLIRTLHCIETKLADMVPADYFINSTIAAAWDVANMEKKQGIPPVYNYVCSTQNPICWRDMMKSLKKNLVDLPSTMVIWHNCFTMNSNYHVHRIYVFLLHTIPAHVADLIARCVGREPMLVEGYKKINKFLDVIGYFATREWNFRNDNTQALWKKLNCNDQKLFEFDMGALEWDRYVYTYARGGRVYLLKDPLDTVPQGRVKCLKLKIAHYVLVGVLLLGLFLLFRLIWSFIF